MSETSRKRGPKVKYLSDAHRDEWRDFVREVLKQSALSPYSFGREYVDRGERNDDKWVLDALSESQISVSRAKRIWYALEHDLRTAEVCKQARHLEIFTPGRWNFFERFFEYLQEPELSVPRESFSQTASCIIKELVKAGCVRDRDEHAACAVLTTYIKNYSEGYYELVSQKKGARISTKLSGNEIEVFRARVDRNYFWELREKGHRRRRIIFDKERLNQLGFELLGEGMLRRAEEQDAA